jgi:hypothetical protein
MKGRDHIEDLGIDGEDNIRIEIGWECMGWIYLEQDRDQWWA